MALTDPPKRTVRVYTGDPNYDVERLAPRQGVKTNPDGSVSTHLMASYDNVVVPTLFQDKNGKWIEPSDPFTEAVKRNEFFSFKTPQEANAFAKGSWKNQYKNYDLNSPEYEKLYNKGVLGTWQIDPSGENVFNAGTLPEFTAIGQKPQELRDVERLTNEYIRDDRRLNRGLYNLLGYSEENVRPRAQRSAFNEIAKQILDTTDEANLTGAQRNIIQKSEYADKLGPSIGSRFISGLQKIVSEPSSAGLGDYLNLLAPLEYPGNLVRGAVKGDFQDALRGKPTYPYVVSSDLQPGNESTASFLNAAGAIGLDPLNYTGASFLANPKALSQAGKFLTTQTPLKNTYKTNPWAFKPNETNWYRQVGKSAIDDALETGVIREAGEEVSPRMWEEFQNQIKRLQGNDAILDHNERTIQKILAGRRPASPFFAKGELFYPIGRKPITTKSGNISKNPAGKGSADYLIETDLQNESFQPAYMKGISLGVPTEIGQTAILKPNPSLRELKNFKLYKQDWLRGYKEIPKSVSQQNKKGRTFTRPVQF